MENLNYNFQNNDNYDGRQDSNFQQPTARKIKRGWLVFIIFFTAVLIIAVGIGGYFIFKKPVVAPVGKCGDNICDEFEKTNPSACLEDCKLNANTEINKNSPFGGLPFFSFASPIGEGYPVPKPDDFDFVPTKDLGLKWGRAHYLV